jgi:membrane-associated phospholipid phosphatase
MSQLTKRRHFLSYQTYTFSKCNLHHIVPVLLILLICNVESRAAGSVEVAGDVLQYLLPGAGAALTLGHKDHWGALQLVGSAATTLGVTYGLKYTFDARRPNGKGLGFPSRHTSLSFSAAEFMRKRYGLEYGIPAYALASFVAYSRVESDNHFAHDVIAGAAIGILSSYIFTRPYKGWNIQVGNGGGFYGVKLYRLW